MNFLGRRSIRKYNQQAIEKDKIQEIMKAAVIISKWTQRKTL